MKKITLVFGILLIMVLQLAAQNGKKQEQLVKQLTHKAKQKINASNLASLNPKAAYLLDSTRTILYDDPDSIIVGLNKFKYLPDGKMKESDIFIDDILLAVGIKIVSDWDIAKMRIVKNEIYSKQDISVPYTFVGVDSLFYNSKNQNYKTLIYRGDSPTSKLTLAGKQDKIFKTNNFLPDTIRTYEFDGANQYQTYFDYNGFDVKGNLIETYYLDLIDALGAGERTTYKYNTKNQITEEIYSNVIENGKWINKTRDIYKYNDLITDNIVYNWNNNTWADSTLIRSIYKSPNKIKSVELMAFDNATSKWKTTEITEAFYDKNNNQILDNKYEIDGTNKILTGITRYWWSLYKDAVPTKDAVKIGYDLKFENPFSHGKIVQVEAPQNQDMWLEVFDINGRLLSRQAVENQQQVMLNLSENGHFVLVLSAQNGEILSQKHLVKL